MPASLFLVLPPRHTVRAVLLGLVMATALPAGAVDLLVSNFTDSPDPATRGGKIVYSATITNNEADTASNVTLAFALDPETTFVSVSDAVQCAYSAGPHQVSCLYPSVKGDLSGPGSADEITVQVTVSSKASAGATVSASAAVSSTDTDTNAGNNTLNQVTTIDNGADLSLALAGSPDPVVAGGTVTYTADATNHGPNTAGTVQVVLTLSPNVSYTSAAGSGWSCAAAGQVVTCTRATGALGALPTISVVTKETGPVSGTITTAGAVSISGSATDFEPANNSATADVTVTTGTDLAITKTVSASKVASSGSTSFTLRPRNLGPFAATSVSVTDTLPAGFSNIAASGSGWSCGVAGQTVTCTAASYAVGATNDITVTADAPAVGSSTPYTNTADIGAATPDPSSANNSGSVNVTVVPPGVDLSITKSKTPNPVAQGGALTSTIRVTNNGPQAARAGEIKVIETLPAGETYAGTFSGSNWSCDPQVGQTVTCTYGAPLAVNALTSNLVLSTLAGSAGTLTNNACATYTDSVGSFTDGVPGNNCAGAGVVATPGPSSIDLHIAKTVDVDPLTWNASTLTYTVTVTNLADASADGVVMTDPIPGYMTGTGVTATRTGGSASAVFSCTTGATVTCTQTGGTIAKNETVVFTIAVTRPLQDSGAGKHTNTASVTSTNQGDLNPANNQASVDVGVEAVADIKVVSSVTPGTTEAGTNATYVLTVNNLGPSSAAGVTLSEVFNISAGTMTFLSATPSTGSCSYTAASTTLDCALGTLASGATETVTVVVRPDYMMAPPPGRTLTGSATVATTTHEAVMANNTDQSVLTIIQAQLDLLINLVDSPDPLGFVPASASPTFPDNVVTYRNTVTNRGPSVASSLVLTYTMTPPAGKVMTFLGDKLASTGQSYAGYCNHQNDQATNGAPLTLTCTFPANFILLANNATTDLYLDFRVDGAPSSSGDTYQSTASITSNEPDSVAANNNIAQTTTVKMRSDLQLSKSARAFIGGVDAAAAAVQVRQPFYWVLTLTNAGPGDSQVTTITDTLPAGLTLYTGNAGLPAPYNAAPYTDGVRWSTTNAAPTSGTCSGTSAITCNVGALESGKSATVLIPVVSATAGGRNNCASATTSEVDPNAANNTNICSAVTVQASSLAGSVYVDLDLNNTRAAGEPGIAGASLTLTGTDDYGNAVSRTTTSGADGSFSITNLSPGSYTLSEAQPAAWADAGDKAGSAGGTPGAIGNDSIGSITLPGNTAATGYLFGEIGKATLSGYVFVDNNTNALRDGGEVTGIAGVTVTLTGNDDLGPVNRTATTGAAGLYQFIDLRPGTYQVQEAVIAGVTHTGMTAGSKGGNDGAAALAPNTPVVGAAKRTVSNIVLASGDSATGYDFGESGQGLSGFVYVDSNGNGIKDAGEAGIPGVALTLSGQTAGGGDVCAAISPNPCTVQSGADGAYSFSGIPASDPSGYRITEQAQGTAPLSNYADGLDHAGSLGGTVANDTLSSIVVTLGQFGADYNFGERAGAIAGRVYLDANDNGVADGGEAGISGVTLTLSGQTASGADVCTVLASCSVTSAADGSFTFANLPAANGAGYTVTETQPVDYAERSNTVGSAGGTAATNAGHSVFSSIALGVATSASGYLFGEKTTALTGFAYLDANNNGVKDGGESGIAGVTFTLSGQSASGADVCTLTSCSVVTGADGSYRFAGLPAANATGYTITEQAQTLAPLASLLDGTVSAGSNCGACTISNASPNTIAALRVDAALAYTGYNFGELAFASLAGRVYVDADASATLGAGEALAGVTLTLTGTDDNGNAVNLTTVSGADGSYRFDQLRPPGAGGYTVTETQPAGYGDFPGASGTAAGTVNGSASGNALANAVSGIVLGVGSAGVEYNFRETGASLAGQVYLDANDNGVRDAGEQALAGVVLTLDGVDARGIAVHRVTQSAADGSYSYTGLGGGVYTIVETQPATVLDGRESAGTSGGTVDNTAFDATAARNTIGAIALAASAAATGYDFAERPLPPEGSITGRVYLDSNGNGRPDAGEPGIGGVALALSGTSAAGVPVSRTTSTAADGTYAFTGLLQSNVAGYQVTQTQPAGYIDGATTVSAGNPGSASSAKPVAAGSPDVIGAIVLGPNARLGGYDFGERKTTGSIAGVVYLDRNNNGVQDAGEPGIAGVSLNLSGTDSSARPVARSTVTGASGGFRFDDLAASDAAGYVLSEVQPAAYGDGKTTVAAGSPGSATAAKPVAAGAADTIGAIVLGAGIDAGGYRFGELSVGARLSGSVYIDLDNDGVRDEGETGIAGVTLLLQGRDEAGAEVSRTVSTGADGAFAFTDLPPSNADGYRLIETQPPGVIDGKTTVPAGAPGAAPSAKPVGVGNMDTIASIRLEAGASRDGYLFGEIPVPSLKPPIVNGYVWLDREHNRVRPLDGSLQGMAGWTVELRQNGQSICAVQTDAQGFYQFDNLHCAGYEFSGLPTGGGFSITFSREGSRMPAVAVSGGSKGRVVPSGGMIADITLSAGEQVVEQNLPLDPAGVVYDAQTRKPVAGAAVTIDGPAGFVPQRHLVGAEAAQTQVVGSDGMYQFLLQNDFPTGVYTLSVKAPAGYLPGLSSAIPVCPGAPVVALVPTPGLVQRSDGAPAASVPLHRPDACVGMVEGGAETTQYYMAFHITNGGSAPILNNHIPLDPMASGGMVLSKTTPMVNVARGELVPYTITAVNGTAATLPDVVVRDRMPPGFKYRSGSARLGGVPAEPKVDGRELSWPARSFAPRERASYTLVLAVGAGVGDGEYVNQAEAVNSGGTLISNIATASVRIVPDPTFDCPDLIGKVFDDVNANGYQDEGEPGLPAVRLATPRGLLVTSDAHGRFHVPCADLPNQDRGANFVMKLDERTLPSGYRVTTANPGDVRVTRGKVVKLNFGATIHRVVRVELSDAAYAPGGDTLAAPWNQQIDTMIEQLKKKPSVLRIAYQRGAAGEQAAQRRASALRDAIRARWRELKDMYPLAIEMEDVQ